MDNKQIIVDALLNLVENIIADVESKTRAQLLDLIEMTVPADKLAPTKRAADTILRDLVHRIVEKNTTAVDIEVRREVPSVETSSELSEKWGHGFKPEELIAFEKLYNELKDDYRLPALIHIEFLKLACISHVKYINAMADNDIKAVKDYTLMFQDAINKLQPK